MIEILPNWHPLFVHFTVALLLVATAAHLLSRFLRHVKPRGALAEQLALVARWNLRLGVGITLLTVAAGWYAYNTVNHDEPSHIAMTVHRNWAMVTLAVFLVVAGWEYYLSRREKGSSSWLFTGLLLIAAGLLLSTAWHGGELVYRHGLGVMSLPKAEGTGHSHEHGAGHDHGDMPAQGKDAPYEDGHSHDDTAHDEHDAEFHATPATGDAVSAPKKVGHTHAPGTPPHKD